VGKYTGNTDHKFLQLANGTLGTYNLWDSYATASLIGPLVAEMRDHQQLDFYTSDIEPLQYAAIDMTVRGIQVNTNAKTTYRRRVRHELNEVDNYIKSVADSEGFKYTNKFPNSKQQVAKLLYDHLKIRCRKRTQKEGRSVDQDALTRVLRNLLKREEKYRKLLHALFHRSRLQTIDSRYLGFSVDEDGRVRPNVKMMATKTLRYAYEDPPLQQYPEEARHIFVAPNGKVLVSADYKQLEARVLAVLADDPVSRAVFEAGGDVHAQNARDLFGWSLDAWNHMDPVRRELARYFAKTFLYRITYGGSIISGDKKLMCPCTEWGCDKKNPPILELKKTEAAAVERRWFQSHPAVIAFQKTVAAEVRRTYFYTPPLGGRRWIAQPWGADLEREVKNIPIQTTAAQIVNRAQVRIYQAGLPIVLQWHDSLVAEVPEDQAQPTVELMRLTMETPVKELGGYSFPVDIMVGRNMGKWSKENPLGLKEVT
jgi:DNA polymerase-1